MVLNYRACTGGSDLSIVNALTTSNREVPMKWKKLGQIITPEKVNREWMITHAMDPTVDHLKEDLFRFYFCGRNQKNQSLIGYADIDLGDPSKIIRTPVEPSLGLGSLGAFDDNGVTASCIVDNEGEKFLYYIGWKPRSTTRFGLMTGLAISDDGGETFRRYSRAPILKLTDREPYWILTAPFVLKDESDWKMWYVSCEGWIHADLPTYNIKLATSNDGINWEQTGKVCLDFIDENETALARPCVIKEKGIYRMWLSYKTLTQSYRIGYAESNDGISWTRKDSLAGISVSSSGWDSEMIEYPYVFKHRQQTYMAYNGNGYGENGAGLAVLEEDSLFAGST